MVNEDTSGCWATCVIYSQGGTAGHLAVGCGDTNLYILDLETRRVLSTLAGHTGKQIVNFNIKNIYIYILGTFIEVNIVFLVKKKYLYEIFRHKIIHC